ncbi:hypothetical protein PQ478_08920 [Alkalihalophilus pseudofirmus]|nr:hypothetical protein [Alkalihalophilus pseudofirmus]WEG18592.1 hypothetical protein PQ478_08920 [Alkalihalophilus pseudofirmus]
MDDKEYQIAMEKEKTKREMISSVFWLVLWLLVITGCTVSNAITF